MIPHLKQSPWLVFDMDEVIVNIRDRLAMHLNIHTGKNISVSQWHQHDLGPIYGLNSEELIKIFYSSKILETATLEPDAVQALRQAKDYGYNVGILTARGWHKEGLEISKKTVAQFELPVDHIVAVPLHAKKHEIISQSFEGTIKGFIDDNPAHVSGVHSIGIPTFVRDRPWNAHMHEYQRVNNLQDFVEQAHQLSLACSSSMHP